ncbi:hypothetical protein JXC34_05465 [Candidatus Woesearchaeota archaeon]|nr:hypothetical protein [Candidatus Woesearchaeota archaeon]
MLTDILLFPGLVFHEFSHFLVCIILGVKVKKVHISFEEGYVNHTVPKSIIKSFLIATAPTFMAFITSLVLANIFLDELWMEALKFYFIFTILYMSTPSKADTEFQQYHKFLGKVITFPLFVIFRLYYYISRSRFYKVLYSILVINLALLLRAAFELRIIGL